MDFPIKAFEIENGTCHIKMEIAEVYGFPNETSFRGGYDIRCNLSIKVGVFSVENKNYYSSTGALYNFYDGLNKRYGDLNGKAEYEVYCPDDGALTFFVNFDGGQVNVAGVYKEGLTDNFLNFEFNSDQSYFTGVLRDLKKIINTFGDGKGKLK